jgi:hypothetical protein
MINTSNESKLKQIRGNYVVTAQRQTKLDCGNPYSDIYDNDYISIPQTTKVGGTTTRKLMTAEAPHSLNDSPSSSFINYTNRVRRGDHAGLQKATIVSEDVITLNNNEQTFS